MGAVAAMAAALVLTPSALAVDEVNTKKLRKGVTTAGVLEHMRTLQRLANANDGNRAATTSGYDASLDYVERRMARFQTVVTAVIANRTLVDGLEVRVQEPSVREAEEAYLQATAREGYEQMAHVRTRLLELPQVP